MTGRLRNLAAVGALLLAAARVAAADAPPGTQVFEDKQGDITVRIAVPDAATEQSVFGVPLEERNVQPVWIEIENGSDGRAIFLPIATDPEYLSPREASWRFHERLHPEADAARDALFAASRMPDQVGPGTTQSGYVFTHRETGLKFVTVAMLRGADEMRFEFVVPVAGPELAVERVDLAKVWPADAIRDVDLDGLRAALAALPCCGANADGSGKADPLNLVIVGDGLQVVFPMVERGWRFVQPLDVRSAAASAKAFFTDGADPEMPVSPMWLYGRREDVALQKPSSSIDQRNHLRLWLTPLRYQGKSVFVGQISRDIGVEFTDKSWYLTTHKVDPDVDLDRDYILQDMLLSGAVDRFGYVEGVGASTPDAPRVNLTGDPYFTDGLRLVLMIGEQRPRFLPLDELDWDKPPLPTP
ncbi:MAG: LssY C-terminal domain-containing protein [Amaricoccus sp.]